MKSLFRLLPLLLLLTFPASAEDSPTGDEIARRILNGTAFDSSGGHTRLRMILETKDGKREERALEVLARKKQSNFETVVRFLSPPDVAGTAFLLLEKGGGQSEQYVYLPGLRRTRRIVGREREGSFMGSDFSYSDLRRADASEGTHRRLPDEDIGGSSTFVVESKVNASAKSPYSRVTTWVRKTDFVPLRTRFYGTDGALVKTLYARRISNNDGVPVVMEARMENGNGHATVLVIDSIDRKADMPDAAFSPTALEHP